MMCHGLFLSSVYLSASPGTAENNYTQCQEIYSKNGGLGADIFVLRNCIEHEETAIFVVK